MNTRLISVATGLALFASSASFAIETRKLIVPTADSAQLIGYSVAQSGDALMLGAPGGKVQPGEAFLVNASNGSITRTLTPSVPRSDDFFGFDLDMSPSHIIVGDPSNPSVASPFPGSVYIFNASTGIQQHRVLPQDSQNGDEFGFATSLDGTKMLIGAPSLGEKKGKAYLFDVPTGQQLHRLQSNDGFVGDEFGWDVSIARDYAVVGAPATYDEGVDTEVLPGHAYIFDAVTGQQRFKLTPSQSSAGDEFGYSIATSRNKAIIGAPAAAVGLGSAYIFDMATGQELMRLQPENGKANDDFGSAVEIDGNLAVVGARGQNVPGAAYVFNLLTGKQLAKLVPSDLDSSDNFGTAVSIQGNRVIVGSPRDDTPLFNSGSAYVFTVPLPGDFDNNGLLAVNDLQLLTDAVIAATHSAAFDLNNDELVNQSDRTIWVEAVANTFFGDSNLDGQFDSGDLITVFVAAEYEDTIDNNSTWTEGDWNGDADFDSSDLILAFQRGAYEKGPRSAVHAVPEPSGFLIAVVVFCALLKSRRC
jgi:outer membrane protein assembly factor BamB